MAYSDYSAHWAYKDLLTYQDMNQLGENDKVNMPIGAIMMWTTATAPSGFVLCDGSSLERAGTYSGLFGVIGTTYGSVDGSHFTVPDLRDNFVVGKSGTKALASTAGSATIAEANLPAHTHGIETPEGGGTQAIWAGTTGGASGYGATKSALQASAKYMNTLATGSGTAYYQPYIALNFIIKY
jgi:microcystin-dependent protein